MTARSRLAGGMDHGAAGRGYGLEVWSQTWWRAQAVEWLDASLSQRGIERTGPAEQPHLRPWATALRVPTTGGPVWLKATGPATAPEVGLYEILAANVAKRVLAPLATDPQRGWIVLPDGGPVLGDALRGPALIEALIAVVPQYAQLQLDLTSSVDAMLAVGVPDMRPQVLPTRLQEALVAVRPYVDSTGKSDDEATYDRIAASADSFAAACAELAAGPVASSLQHDDLHPWNVFAADYDTEPVFFDWGDTVVAHPFASLLVTLRVVKNLAGGGDDSDEVRRVRDAYLEVFTQLAPRAELLDQLELACHTGKVVRSLSWARVLGTFASAQEDPDAEDAGAPFDWLALLLDDSFLGRVGDDD